jgi:hypothetical protein
MRWGPCAYNGSGCHIHSAIKLKHQGLPSHHSAAPAAALLADFTLMGWLLRICPLDQLNIALCKQTEALSNRCASLAAPDCIELAVVLQACNRLH